MAKTASEMVTLIDETIEALLTGQTASRSLAGRSWTALDLPALKALRETYLAQARDEDLASGDKVPLRMFGVRFGKES